MVFLRADLDTVPDRREGSEILREVLSIAPVGLVELWIDYRSDFSADLPPEAASAAEYVKSKLESENSMRPWYRRQRLGPPRMTTQSREDVDAFCNLAYWSLSAEALNTHQRPYTLFSAADGGEFAEFSLAPNTVSLLLDRFDSASTAGRWIRRAMV